MGQLRDASFNWVLVKGLMLEVTKLRETILFIIDPYSSNLNPLTRTQSGGLGFRGSLNPKPLEVWFRVRSSGQFRVSLWTWVFSEFRVRWV